MTRAGEVAWLGMTVASGDRKMANRKRMPVTIEANPVRPPSATPAALSM